MNIHQIPQPQVDELQGDEAWQAWDKAVLEQDTGFMSLEPIKPAVSERSVMRAEKQA